MAKLIVPQKIDNISILNEAYKKAKCIMRYEAAKIIATEKLDSSDAGIDEPVQKVEKHGDEYYVKTKLGKDLYVTTTVTKQQCNEFIERNPFAINSQPIVRKLYFKILKDREKAEKEKQNKQKEQKQ